MTFVPSPQKTEYALTRLGLTHNRLTPAIRIPNANFLLEYAPVLLEDIANQSDTDSSAGDYWYRKLGYQRIDPEVLGLEETLRKLHHIHYLLPTVMDVQDVMYGGFNYEWADTLINKVGILRKSLKTDDEAMRAMVILLGITLSNDSDPSESAGFLQNVEYVKANFPAVRSLLPELVKRGSVDRVLLAEMLDSPSSSLVEGVL